MAKPPAETTTKEAAPPAPVEEKTTAVANFVPTGYEEFEGQGFEDHSKEDYSVPFLTILQGLSPQMETVEGAKLGHIINSVTNDVYAKEVGLPFVPCATKHCFVEWLPRDQGGGFVAQHELEADVVVHCKEKQEFGEYKTPSGNDLIETFYVYGVAVTDDGGYQAAIAFSSTKIRPYKSWMTKARGIQIAVRNQAGQVVKRITPPLFAHRYRLKTVKQKNKKGEYYNWDITFDGPDASAARIDPKSDLFVSAVAVSNMVKEGTIKLDTKNATNDAGGGGEGSASGGDDGTDDAPF